VPSTILIFLRSCLHDQEILGKLSVAEFAQEIAATRGRFFTARHVQVNQAFALSDACEQLTGVRQ
jgi:hypothetical protein